MMPRWADGGSLGGGEQVRREFGSDLVESRRLWVTTQEDTGYRSLGLETKDEGESIVSCPTAKRKGSFQPAPRVPLVILRKDASEL